MTVWMDIDEHYQVSDSGQVRKQSGTPVNPYKNDSGYLLVRLSKPRREKRVHRLVAGAFLPNPLRLPEVNHIDGIKINCAVSNLEWCTTQHNARHAAKLRLNKIVKLTDSQAGTIKHRVSRGESRRALAREYGVTHRTICFLARGLTYTWLPSPPVKP